MNHWSFIAGAYGIAIIPVTALLLWAWSGMRRAEAAAADLAGK